MIRGEGGVELISVGAGYKSTHRTSTFFFASTCVKFSLLATNSPTHLLKGPANRQQVFGASQRPCMQHSLLSPAPFARARALFC